MKTCLTIEDVEGAIYKEFDYKLGDKTTVVLLKLKNDFEVIGISACVDPEKYDHEIGKKFARQRALDKVWELEGYLLQTLIAVEQHEPGEQVQ